jgi:hypothetical protein
MICSVKDIRCEFVCGCERRNGMINEIDDITYSMKHAFIVYPKRICKQAQSLPAKCAAPPAKVNYEKNVANTATGISCEKGKTKRKHQHLGKPRSADPPSFDAQALVFQRNASLSPVRLGCSALSGLWTKWANCGLTPMGEEISISRPPLTLTGSCGPTLWRPDFLNGQTFFFGQSVVREYLLVGETGAGSRCVGYGGEMTEAGEPVW